MYSLGFTILLFARGLMHFTLIYFKKMALWLLPPTCILCKHPADRVQDLCSSCLNELPILPQGCKSCAKTLWAGATLCGDCQKSPPAFDLLFALYAYQPPITKWIMELKFQEKLIYARVLGELLAETIKNRWYNNTPLPQCIIPIPLHTKRLQERGYNQALEIAKTLAKSLNIPINNAASRIKFTQPQARLRRNERAKNVKNAFKINKQIANLHIAVVDDVITTGQTLQAFCLALKKAGAKRIDVWCCAKA
jgi:ComF family protein